MRRATLLITMLGLGCGWPWGSDVELTPAPNHVPSVSYEAEVLVDGRLARISGPWPITSTMHDVYRTEDGQAAGSFLRVDNVGPWAVYLEPDDEEAERLLDNVREALGRSHDLRLHTDECNVWSGRQRITCTIDASTIRDAFDGRSR